MMKKFIKWAWGNPDMKIIKIKSYKGWFGPYGFEWPVMVVEYGSIRSVSSPVWNKDWFKSRFFKFDKKEENDTMPM